MNELEALLTQYETDVRFPDVSGMEHLDMLLTRSRLADANKGLTTEQAKRLSEADQQLLQNAERFHQAITAVANVAEWRNTAGVSPEEWWWYLDVLVSVPQYSVAGA